MNREVNGERVFVDAHVHFYHQFDLSRQLRFAHEHFRQAAAESGAEASWRGCLLLTESAGYDYFRALLEGNPGAQCDWTFGRTDEPESLRAEGPAGESLYIVNGRQIVVEENLEVLALCVNVDIPDDLPMSDVVDRVNAAGGLAVVPWGAGKWLGSRGRFLDGFMKATGSVYLGDNSNRPGFLGYPRHFVDSAAADRHILPGTDPLPIRDEESRTGSFGFHFELPEWSGRPAATIREAVTGGHVSIEPYGRLESPFRFFRNQFNINIRKRMPGRKAVGRDASNGSSA